ncbi:hypothetical protein HZH68_001100 [Vespula germanica]|uniref:Uncharacterized protein n=1 Tax=Vespula germanica TaxID=30212 RepID=A0A834NUV9_VESGE|nr:hypothetical protein HZH68_001100 [Vespula germanica]
MVGMGVQTMGIPGPHDEAWPCIEGSLISSSFEETLISRHPFRERHSSSGICYGLMYAVSRKFVMGETWRPHVVRACGWQPVGTCTDLILASM